MVGAELILCSELLEQDDTSRDAIRPRMEGDSSLKGIDTVIFEDCVDDFSPFTRQ